MRSSQLRKSYLRKVPVISIVDDDESVREVTTGLVRSFGYVAAPFASAEEFLQSDCVRDTSCLISDVQMSGLSGVELQDRLNAAGHRVPIIFITASRGADSFACLEGRCVRLPHQAI
jgi:FixJ family two-component response regulator